MDNRATFIIPEYIEKIPEAKEFLEKKMLKILEEATESGSDDFLAMNRLVEVAQAEMDKKFGICYIKN